MSEEWSADDLRANFEWGGQIHLDPAIFDRAIAKVKADALREAVIDFEDNVGIGEFAEQSHRSSRGGWAHIDEAWESQGPYMDWLRNRADKLDPS